ncbi:putative disease resistance protein RGA4 isoform X2 [Lolium perenne]|uniref:putative disease resistance protein RGA4 isoform X2 n=1 Tax=Lolium perenne TaxID=4522 RepID=UPI003A98DA8B
METAIGAASWLVGKVLSKLSDDLVSAYVASSELGLNSEQIKAKLKYMQGLLHAAQDRDVISNPGLQSLLEDLSKKADEAEDALDELHYFMIQDQLDGTLEATTDQGDGLYGHALHGRHAARHSIGNWLPCFSCPRTQDDDSVADTVVTSNPHCVSQSDSGNGGGHVGKLKFDRVVMSNKIKSVIEGIHNLCDPVSNLLNKIPNTSTVVTTKRPQTGSIVSQDKLFGRSAIFDKTVNMLTGVTYQTETLSVLPIVGPGGMGKTTFTQHLYNDETVEGYFAVKVWICVSTDFDVHKLTRQIHSYIPALEQEKHKCTNETASLDQLQKSIIERLKSKMFLIVLDDIWNCNSEANWKNLLSPFTKGGTKGNIVLVTTRFPSIVEMVKTTDPVELCGLEPNDFFALFEACIFDRSKLPANYDDDLIDVARNIAMKLKGSPLAANTVGRLLRKNLSREYWMEVFEKNEWKDTKNDDDIMPSLKISYDYLPFYLKKCFSYCSLFPEDYKFDNFEITCFWITLGIVDSSSQNVKNYLEELVGNGFLMKGGDNSRQYYVMHDLFHELSRNVSSQECFNICNLSFRADDIPKSIRHLSITIENIYDESFVEEMGKLRSVIDIENLRSLMIFGLHDVRIANMLKDTFKDIKGLRVLFIAMRAQQSLPKNFSNLIHLQYLKISSPYDLEITLPSTLCRLYHLKFLDLINCHGIKNLPKDFSRLVYLRHFHSSKNLHSNIPGVGKMKHLEELKEFRVKKENDGFELKELGELSGLGGELSICNLETVRSKGEASDAKLKNKRNLKELRLVWGEDHPTIDDDVLDGLHPPNNIRVLGIINPGGSAGPSWLCGDVSTKKLESLHLEGVSWSTLPSFEQLSNLSKVSFRNIVGMRVFGPGIGGVTERSFTHLKEIVFEDMAELEEWVGGPSSHMFSRLESIKINDCPFICSFPFLECSDIFTKLCTLDIKNCPRLSLFPLMPHTSTLTYVCVENNGSKLLYDGKEVSIKGYTRPLAFHIMDKVELMKICDVSHITLSDLQKLKSLRSMHFKRCDNVFSAELYGSVVLRSVQNLHIEKLQITGELFSQVLRSFPGLSQLSITKCENLTLVPVEDGGLWDLKMLQSFKGFGCGKLFSGWPMGEVGGGGRAMNPFPTWLREFDISEEPSMRSMGLLSNLTSLTSLSLISYEELTTDGFNPLMTVNLKQLGVDAMYSDEADISIAGDLLSMIARSKLMRAGSFQLEELWVDSISSVLTAPICSHLAATLQTLWSSHDQRMRIFTEEQEQALQLLTSLEDLEFIDCYNLRSLPQGLGRLSSLKRLGILSCEKIVSLPPKEGLPTSLEKLDVYFCSPELTEQAKELKEADPWFSVSILE